MHRQIRFLYFDCRLKIFFDSSLPVSATIHRTLTCLTSTTQNWTTTTSKIMRTPASFMCPASSISLLPLSSQRANHSDSLATKIVSYLLNTNKSVLKWLQMYFMYFKCVFFYCFLQGLLCYLLWVCTLSCCSSCSILLKALMSF